jgi:hypothetical protein
MPNAGEIIDAAVIDEGTYTPTLTASTTNPTLGSGSSAVGWWQRIGNLIIGGATIRFGTSGAAAGSGNYIVSLPFDADTTFMQTGGLGISSAIGDALVRDNSAVNTGSRQATCYLGTVGDVLLALANGTNQVVTDAVPFTWAASDGISINFVYKADPAAL